MSDFFFRDCMGRKWEEMVNWIEVNQFSHNYKLISETLLTICLRDQFVHSLLLQLWVLLPHLASCRQRFAQAQRIHSAVSQFATICNREMHFTQSVIDNLKVYLILQMLWIWMSDRMWCGYQCQYKYLCTHDYCSRQQDLRHIYGKEWWWLLFFYCWLRLLLLLSTFRFRSRLPEAAGVHEPVNNTETRVQLRSFQSWWWWGWWGWGWRIIMINSVCWVVRVSTKNSLDGHLLN